MINVTTLVGVFDDLADALRARERLQAAGIGASSIRVEHEDGADATPQAPAAETPTRRRGFFAELFGLGDDDESPSHYAEAVRRGGVVLAVDVTDDDRQDEINAILQDAGAVDIDERVQAWQAGGYTGYDDAAPRLSSEQIAAERARVLPVIKEELKVGKREVGQGLVRVHRRMVSTPVEEQVALHDERVVVERTPVDRAASEAELTGALEDKDIELRETTEEPVVEKTARVVEEVRVGTEGSDRTETVRDTVRSSQVEVERSSDADGRSRRSSADTALGALADRADVMSANYTGPERRRGGSASYAGQERRIAQPA